MVLELATDDDAAVIADLRNAVNEHLTLRHGKGSWSGCVTDRGVRSDMKRGSVFVARDAGRVIGTLTLSTRKPWAIDKSYFGPSKKPLYLTSMAVEPALQRRGVGRRCLDEARRIATDWPADAIRLDAFDSVAGAGEFYSKCGYREVGRVMYRNTPLIYFEMLIAT